MPWWVIILLIIYFVVCAWLIMVILLQSGKGGGLSSLGGASQGLSDALGATGAEKTLNKITVFSAVGFMVLAIILSVAGSRVVGTTAEIFGDEAPQAPVTQPFTGDMPESVPEMPPVATPE